LSWAYFVSNCLGYAYEPDFQADAFSTSALATTLDSIYLLIQGRMLGSSNPGIAVLAAAT
jgi:hypothetical protein